MFGVCDPTEDGGLVLVVECVHRRVGEETLFEDGSQVEHEDAAVFHEANGPQQLGEDQRGLALRTKHVGTQLAPRLDDVFQHIFLVARDQGGDDDRQVSEVCQKVHEHIQLSGYAFELLVHAGLAQENDFLSEHTPQIRPHGFQDGRHRVDELEHRFFLGVNVADWLFCDVVQEFGVHFQTSLGLYGQQFIVGFII